MSMHSSRYGHSARASRFALALAFVLSPLVGHAGAAAAPDGSIGGLKAKFIDVNGVKARYYEAGEGEPMLMIHGGSVAGSSTANVFSRNIPGLAKRFHVYAVDRLGSGLSGNPADPRQLETPGQVEFIYQFIKALKLGPLHLVGHSAGGAIAFYLAIDHPEMFKTLTIIGQGPASGRAADGPTRLEPELKKCPDQNVYEGLRCRVEKLGWLPTAFDPEYWEADAFMAMQPKSKEARAAMVKLAEDPDRSKRMTAYKEQAWDKVKNGGVLQMPVLLYVGKQDVLDWGVADPTAMLRGELAMYDIIGAKNQKVEMIVINEGGHFMYREHPAQFNNDLIHFIDFWTGASRATSAASAAPAATVK